MNAVEFIKENYTLTNGGEDYMCNHSGQLVGAEDIAEAYHDHKLKLLGIANVVGQSEQLHSCKYVKRIGESCTLNNNCKYPKCK